MNHMEADALLTKGKLGGLLERLPDIQVPPRTVMAADGAERKDPGGSIAWWRLPGNSNRQVTVMLGINSTVANVGLPFAAAFAALPEKQRPTVTFFDYRGFGESRGIALEALRFGQMRADAALVMEQHKFPQILVGVSMGGALALLRAQKDYAADQRYHAPRKVLAVVAVNAAYDFAFLDGIDTKAKLMMRHLMRDQPDAGRLTTAAAQDFVREAQQHVLQKHLSPHGISQPTFGCPVLVIQGQNDPLIPSLHSEQLVRSIAAPAKLYVPLSGADHNLSPATMQTLVVQGVNIHGKHILPVAWLEEKLQADRGWMLREHYLPHAIHRAKTTVSDHAPVRLWKMAAAALTASVAGAKHVFQSEAMQGIGKQIEEGLRHIDSQLFPPRPGVPLRPLQHGKTRGDVGDAGSQGVGGASASEPS